MAAGCARKICALADVWAWLRRLILGCEAEIGVPFRFGPEITKISRIYGSRARAAGGPRLLAFSSFVRPALRRDEAASVRCLRLGFRKFPGPARGRLADDGRMAPTLRIWQGLITCKVVTSRGSGRACSLGEKPAPGMG